MLSLTCYVISCKALPSRASFPTPSGTLGTEWSLGAIQVCIPWTQDRRIFFRPTDMSTTKALYFLSWHPHLVCAWEQTPVTSQPGPSYSLLNNLLLKIWSTDQQHWHHLGACEKCRTQPLPQTCWIKLRGWGQHSLKVPLRTFKVENCPVDVTEGTVVEGTHRRTGRHSGESRKKGL